MSDQGANETAILDAAEAVMKMEYGFAVIVGPPAGDVWPDSDSGLFVQWCRAEEGLRFEACDPATSGGRPHSEETVKALNELGLHPPEDDRDVNFYRLFEYTDVSDPRWSEVLNAVTKLACTVLFEVFSIDPGADLDIEVVEDD